MNDVEQRKVDGYQPCKYVIGVGETCSNVWECPTCHRTYCYTGIEFYCQDCFESIGSIHNRLEKMLVDRSKGIDNQDEIDILVALISGV